LDFWRFEMGLIMLCGIPTSGKSTYVNELLLDYPDAVVLSTDNYIEGFAKESGKTYDEVFESSIKKAGDHLYRQLYKAIGTGKVVIWDQTNLTSKVRKKKLKHFPLSYIKKCFYFEISLDEAIERNKRREGKFIPEDVLKRMHSQFQIPTEDEGFNTIIKG